MLTINDRAPDFILPDKSTGGQMALVDMLGSYWIVTLWVPSTQKNEEAQQFIENAVARDSELRERRLRVLIIGNFSTILFMPGPSANVHVLLDAKDETAKQYECCDAGTCFYLIARDGRIAKAGDGIPSLDEILYVISNTFEASKNELAAAF